MTSVPRTSVFNIDQSLRTPCNVGRFSSTSSFSDLSRSCATRAICRRRVRDVLEVIFKEKVVNVQLLT